MGPLCRLRLGQQQQQSILVYLCFIPDHHEAVVVLCPMSTVRLVSSGKEENSVTISVEPLSEEDDITPNSVICEP